MNVGKEGARSEGSSAAEVSSRSAGDVVAPLTAERAMALQATAGNRALASAIGTQVGLQRQATKTKSKKKGVEERIAEHDEVIDRVSKELGFNASLVRGIIAAESGGDPNKVSKTGYTGLMQARKGSEYKDPEKAIRAGIEVYTGKLRSIKRFLDDHGIDLESMGEAKVIETVMVGYNAGQETVKRAMGWAIKDKKFEEWYSPRYFVRALISTGAYSAKTALPGKFGKTPSEQIAAELAQLTGSSVQDVTTKYQSDGRWDRSALIEAVVRKVEQERRSFAVGKKGLASFPTFEELETKASSLLVFSARWKHDHQKASGGYVAKVLKHYDRYERQAGRPGLEQKPSAGKTPSAAATPKATTNGGVSGPIAGLIAIAARAMGATAVNVLYGLGVRDPNMLTNILFWARHPDMAGKKIGKGEPALARDWIDIRDTMVTPTLRGLTQAKPDGAAKLAAKPAAKPTTKSKKSGRATPSATLGEGVASAPPPVNLEGGTNKAYKLDWDRDAAAFDIEGSGTLRELFTKKLEAEMKRTFKGEFTDYSQTLAHMEKLLKSDPVKADEIRRKLWQARQYALVETLHVSKSDRYEDLKKDGKLSTYCNIYGYDMVTAMGAYIPRVWWKTKAEKEIASGKKVISPSEYRALKKAKKLGKDVIAPFYDDTIHEMNANSLDDWMNKWGTSFGWSRTNSIDDAQAAANSGKIVVVLASKINPKSSGHISVVLAESDAHKAPTKDGKRTAPLQSQAGKYNWEYGDTAEGKKGKTAWWAGKDYKHEQIVDPDTGEKTNAGHFWIHDGSVKEGILPKPPL